MTITFLKKAGDMQALNKSIKFLLHQHLNGPDKARPLHRVHASEMTREGGLCPRYYALHDVTKKKPKDSWLSTSEQVTFHIGRVLQDAVVNWFADMGKAVCHWKCVGCGRLHEFQQRPQRCEICGVHRFLPEEARFESAKTGASCGVDMLLSLGDQKLRPVELKTMAPDTFKALAAPLAEHRLRTNLYLRIIAESAHPWSDLVDTKRATVFYISKGGYGCFDPQLKTWGLKEQFSPFKEFDVVRNDADTEEMSARAEMIKQFREGAIGMPCGVCATALSKRAQSCSYKAACFSGEHPPERQWTK
jgi:hypothetical protein